VTSTTSPPTFSRARHVSLGAIVTVTLLAGILNLLDLGGSQQWQVWLAVVALAVGIPHGALDHLVTVPSMKKGKMALFISGYVALAAAVTVAILQWPLWGFVGVVLMSAVHFGMGDASFLRQQAPRGEETFPWWLYAIPAGAVPVVIPLTGAGSEEALALVNPELIGWHFGLDQEMLWASVIAAVIAIAWLVVSKQHAAAVDLTALLALVLVAPPLVAFAAYFGLWHAFRHTARLTLEFPRATLAVKAGQWIRAMWVVTRPGLPALVGTMAVAGVITWFTDWQLVDYFFVALAIVWALTVPHMALTWNLDRKALGIPART
jgi:Brp/Blh family beta-carotene 15,15'-monooxygenase